MILLSKRRSVPYRKNFMELLRRSSSFSLSLRVIFFSAVVGRTGYLFFDFRSV